ncbi:hypothetical protein JX580_08975 [Thiomicrospira microaerophila]|uniref:hypothetical protein n=1 Tax=Thiomicrospira microaerophila TaxID=406020 RepID=UPI00200D734C|nr:hypothetical protein [Thiomicrospira microaerophila]UQB41795.1 hypothetical protein JX580_08975 [Thiomicrospira microaerophila]
MNAMFNKLTSWINLGTINQENIILPTTVKTLISTIRSNFFDGEIQSAIDALKDAKEEHQQNIGAKYHLLVLEAEIKFQLKNFEKVSELLDYIDNHFQECLDGKFFEMKASLLSLQGNRKEFNLSIVRIKNEFADTEIEDEYFEILFNLNSGNYQKAKTLFEHSYQDVSTDKNGQLSKKTCHLGALIYQNLYNQKRDDEHFEMAKKYFDCLGNEELNFFEQFEKAKFHSFREVDCYLNHFKPLNESFSSTLVYFNKILKGLSYFEHDYRNIIINHYLHCLFFTDIEAFFNEYPKYRSDEIDIVNFVHFHFNPNQEKLENTVIQNRLIEQNEPELLIQYLDRTSQTDPNIVRDFLESNKSFLEDPKAFNIYTNTLLNNNFANLEDVYKEAEQRKGISEIDYLTFLEIEHRKNSSLSKKQIKKIITIQKSAAQKQLVSDISLNLLALNNQSKEYLSIGSELKGNTFILEKILQICLEDKELLFSDFEKFISQSFPSINHILVGNIYLKFGKLSKAYNQFSIAWQSESSQTNFKLNIASNTLYQCSLRYFLINNEQNSSRINVQQDSLFRAFLEEHYDKLTIRQIVEMSFFMIVVEKSFNEGFKYINKKLLSAPISEVDDDTKHILVSIYFYTIINKINIGIDTPSNIVLKKEDQFFLSLNQYDQIDESFSIELLPREEFELEILGDEYETNSLFHQICNLFIYEMQSDYFIRLDVSKSDPIADIKPLLIQQAKSQANKLDIYNSGGNISFHQLVGEYKKYFGLIPHILENPNTSFDAGKCRIVSNKNKIITLSSIIFLDHIDELDNVLTRNDVYIQQTTIDWLSSFIKELSVTDEIMTMFSDGESIFREIHTKSDIEENKIRLLSLARKVRKSFQSRIIDDREEVLEFSESFEMFVPLMGILEYRALSYAYNNDFQVISEDRIFEIITESTNLAPTLSSNSLALIDVKKKFEDNEIEFYESLHQKGYRDLFDQVNVRFFISKLVVASPNLETTIQNSKILRFILNIAQNYHLLGFLVNYYENNYKFIAPMIAPPERDFIAVNIEDIFKFLESGNHNETPI